MNYNQDFKDLFKILNENNVRYLIVGAYAVLYYSEPRLTKDLDVWIKPDGENAQKVWDALAEFGAPMNDIQVKDFTDEKLVYQIGIEPNRIDILPGIDGVKFDDAWQNRNETVYGGEKIFIIGKEDLIKNKKAMSRKKDLLDLENLL